MIKLENVFFSYGDKPILENFNLIIKNGECVCLTGKSGCGKTTVTRLILGLETTKSGFIDAPQKISCVFQEDRLLPQLDLIKNVCLPLNKSSRPFAKKIINHLGLSGNEKKRISQLSGGMKRRVAIARAICYGGNLLILDEAFNGIDTQNKKIISEIIKQEFLDKNRSVLMISHIPEDAALLNARTISM